MQLIGSSVFISSEVAAELKGRFQHTDKS